VGPAGGNPRGPLAPQRLDDLFSQAAADSHQSGISEELLEELAVNLSRNDVSYWPDLASRLAFA
jgi:hypothetical protein